MAAKAMERIAEVGMGFGEARLQPHRLTVVGGGLLELLESTQNVSKLCVQPRLVGA
jgi:hypothetical protein